MANTINLVDFYKEAVECGEPLLQFFSYAHLPPHLSAVSEPFGKLAATLARSLPRGAERTTAIRKLLESKDCAVRSVVFISITGD